MAGQLPDLPDVWAAVGTSSLPEQLVAAFKDKNWTAVRSELSGVMDGAITDGPFGRELLQLVLGLPPDIDTVFDRYRAAAMFDHGDWDGLRTTLPSQSIEPLEIRGKRDILTAPVDRTTLPQADTPHQRWAFEVTEYQARHASAALRHWTQRIAGRYPAALWERQDIAIGRHIRYRQLHDAALLAAAEAQGGRLAVALSLSNEATRLGDPREPIRALAQDLYGLARLGMGEKVQFDLAVPRRICEPTGPSPLGTGELLMYILPLLPLRDDDSLEWSARLLAYIASRLASPRWQLQADSWRVASELRSGIPSNKTELSALLARSRRAAPGLKGLPIFLNALAQRRIDLFDEAEVLARHAGNTWLQVSCLIWMMALDPRPRLAKQLRLLLDITGWRRPVLVPTEIAADAALGMTAIGQRSESILELALTADRPNVTTELVARYIDDPNTSSKVRLAAVDALARVGTTHSREILSRLALRRDEIGRAAAGVQQRPGVGLSEREIEVLSLAADGLTNKQIGEKLFLSPHTIARHLANARAKLGASNRAEAAVRLHRAGVD